MLRWAYPSQMYELRAFSYDGMKLLSDDRFWIVAVHSDQLLAMALMVSVRNSRAGLQTTLIFALSAWAHPETVIFGWGVLRKHGGCKYEGGTCLWGEKIPVWTTMQPSSTITTFLGLGAG